MASLQQFARWLERDGGELDKNREQLIEDLLAEFETFEDAMVAFNQHTGMSLSDWESMSKAQRLAFLQSMRDQLYGKYDVTLEMLQTHAGCASRTPLTSAIAGETLDREKRGKPYWYRYDQLLPILNAKSSTAQYTWPTSVDGLKKTAKNSK